MNSVKLASMTGLALLLAACGSGNSEEPAAEETTAAPAAEETATPTGEATPAASETPSASATPSEAAAKPSATPAPAASATVAAATPPAGFNMCKACHSVEKGKHGIGPSLAGIYGTKAGDIAGYEFSKPMKESGLKWNDATLDKYLTDPRGVVPGTKMSFAGLKDETKRKEVIAYLKSLK